MFHIGFDINTYPSACAFVSLNNQYKRSAANGLQQPMDCTYQFPVMATFNKRNKHDGYIQKTS